MDVTNPRVIWLALIVLQSFNVSTFAKEFDPPNILIILADDLGFSDLGCYGSEIETPNLDRLAAQGLKFTQFYNTARCWPTRAGIMTGFYAQQVRRDALPKVVPSGANGNRPLWAKLLPEMLKPIGYRCYHSGKWHLDGNPLQTGFDHSYQLNDHDRYFSPKFHSNDDQPLPPVDEGNGYYATTAIAEHSIKCLREHSQFYVGKPFFQYLCFTSPHFPLQALPKDIFKYRETYLEGWDVVRARRYERQQALGLVTSQLSLRDPITAPSWNPTEEELQAKIGPMEVARAVAWKELTDEQRTFQAGKMAIHAAMIDRMDQEIGLVLKALVDLKMFDNTLILFLSDNGASAEQIIRGDGHDPAAPPGSAKTFLGLGPGWSTVSNAPFRLHKSWVHEGGIATPLIACWPQGINERGGMRHTAGHVIDIVPTVLEVARTKRIETWNGEPVPSLPGRSLVPVFEQNVEIARDNLWWYHDGNRALRVANWKLVSSGKDAPWELFDLSVDRSETQNLAAIHPERVRELETTWRTKMQEFRELASQDLSKQK